MPHGITIHKVNKKLMPFIFKLLSKASVFFIHNVSIFRCKCDTKLVILQGQLGFANVLNVLYIHNFD